MELVLATNNPHKRDELEIILSPHKILLPSRFDIDFSFEETGTTYFANAYGKAEHLFYQLKEHNVDLPVLADDSGLSVYALDGAPGIYSSRYGAPAEKEKLPASERNRYLLSVMEGIEDRRAFFVCCLVCIFSEFRFYSVQETVEGRIHHTPQGDGGFGYDPIFYMPDLGKTLAELPEGEKHSLSHRGKAGKVLMHTLEGELP